METLKINVYNDNDEVVKTCEAQLIDLKFGAIRSIMKLLNVDNIENTGELLKAVYNAWDQLTVVLEKCFPDMNDSDFDNVKLSELIPVLITILKLSFGKVLEIPNDSKN